MAIRKKKNTDSSGRSFSQKDNILKKLYQNLSFQLTNSQINVLKEIVKSSKIEDLAKNSDIHRRR